MTGKRKLKIIIDVLMTFGLLLLMPYELVGDAAHEWIGIGMFVLMILHHMLNRAWLCSLFKGRYTPVRIVQTLLVVLVLICMLGSMVSGILLSRHVFSFLEIRGVASVARSVHMASAYWGLAFMSLHLGLHWSMVLGMMKKVSKAPSAVRTWCVRGAGAAIAAYGVSAFIKREIGSYMLLRIHFVFFDYEEPLIFFLMDYMAVMGLFVWTGHYIGKLLKKKRSTLRKEKSPTDEQ